MPTTIQNDVLVKTLLQHLKSKSKVSVNFTFTPDYINVQSSDEYIFDTIIKGEYSRDMVGTSFSVIITNAIQLLKIDSGVTKIIKHGDEVVVFEQEEISMPFNTSYDERINISLDSLDNQGRITLVELSSVLKGFKGLINTSKSLEVGIPPVIISSGKVYCIYSNTIHIDSTSLVFPDMEIPYNTYNNLSKNVIGSPINILTDTIKKVIIVQVANESMSTTSYKKPNLELIASIENKINELSYVGSYNIKIIQGLEHLFKCFPREVITLSTYKDGTIGIRLSVSSGKTVKAGIKDIETTSNINISTTQFDALYKTFKENYTVDIYQGRDIICIKGMKEKTLILSGMTF